ncbi:VIT domain-containing protein [Novosphingobium terrae]|uniref:VIT domain-containing protein n=1 Tax=Novosphingobium terrae TaxID=2726189 RepID=UPI001981EDBE|nr:VIT domain-containing protein [Novosphingobium terrae]
MAAPAHNPELAALSNGIRDAAHAAPLRLRKLDIDVQVHGAVAQVMVDAAFINPGATTLEGDFRFALPDGAVVTGYALDVNGAMIDGVLVDRPRAKALYEARVRRGADPGLAEIKAGNIFETHVFPIFPQRGRRIRLRFTMPIPLAGLNLPLNVEQPSEGWSTTIRVEDASAAPRATLPDGRPARFEREGPAFVVRSGSQAQPIEGALILARPALPDLILNRHANGEDDVQLGGVLPRIAGSTARPERLSIYWDRSRARLASRLPDDLALVRLMIERTHPSSIELIAVNSSGAQRKHATNAEEAVTWLQSLTYRGASSFAAVAQDSATDRCLLFANGHPTLDLAVPFAPRCRLDAITSAPAPDLAWLRHIAQAHGGTAHRIVAGQIDPLAMRLAAPFAGVIALHDRDGKALPFVPLETTAGQWLILAKAPEAGPLNVQTATNGVIREEQRSIPHDGTAFDGTGALLASDRLVDLTAPSQRQDYVALSRRYGIASPSLSFLVLETAQDYFAAKIDPPAGFPAEWRDDFQRQRKIIWADQEQEKGRWIDSIAVRWQEKVQWWKTRFNPQAKPAKVFTSDRFDNTAPPPPVNVSASPPPIQTVVTPPPAAPVAAPPAPPAPRSPSRPEDDNNIVVTGTAITPARGRAASANAAAESPEAAPRAQIVIDAWQADRPYLELYDGKPADFTERFLEAEARHGTLPIFYLDTAEWLRKHGRQGEAVEMVLSALELPSANEETLGIVAARLERYGALDRAVELRERAAALDPERPQPRRLLALTLARRAKLSPAHAREDLQRAIALLYDIATSPQAAEWEGIELIALDEANALLPRLKALGGSAAIDPRLVFLMDTDLRVVIDWTNDASDMDLWVDEPSHERAIYDNPRTAIGGNLSHDMTRGYGPEEYMLHRAPAGTYAVHANVFALDRLDPNGATILTAHLIRDFGRPNEQDESVDVELKRDENGAKAIGQIKVEEKLKSR